MQQQIAKLAEFLINELGVEGIRNSGGKWQRVNDESALQRRVEKKLSEYFHDARQQIQPTH